MIEIIEKMMRLYSKRVNTAVVEFKVIEKIIVMRVSMALN